jgi:hypothetical protein
MDNDLLQDLKEHYRATEREFQPTAVILKQKTFGILESLNLIEPQLGEKDAPKLSLGGGYERLPVYTWSHPLEEIIKLKEPENIENPVTFIRKRWKRKTRYNNYALDIK